MPRGSSEGTTSSTDSVGAGRLRRGRDVDGPWRRADGRSSETGRRDRVVRRYLTHPPASTYTFTSKAQLKTAVNAWTSNNQDEHSEALNYYGPISKWDVSPIMDMSELFKGKNSFNDDISAWDARRPRGGFSIIRLM